MLNRRAHTLRIRTPEGIVFSQPLAGPIPRFLAWAIDLVCIALGVSLLNLAIGFIQLISLDLARALALLLFFAISVGYGMVAEWYWRGQTLGKRVLRLRVVDAEGRRLQFSQIAIRNLLRVVDQLPALYLVGGATLCLSRRVQRLGDLAANTVVVRLPRLAKPDLDQVQAGKYNSLAAQAHLAARLRQRVSPREAALAMQAVLRRDRLEPEARMSLFAELAEHFRAKVRFPPEATEGLTDEQYVRNVVDVLYRSASPPPRPASKRP